MPLLLVIGKTGQLARALAAGTLPPGWRRDFAGRERLDLEDADSIRRTIGSIRPDVVVNAAAYTAVDRAETDWRRAFGVNAVGPGILAEAARAAGAWIVQPSTDYVFDGTRPGEWRETDTPGPLNLYGMSKLAGEYAVRAANPLSLVLRTSWLVSATGSNFARTMLRLASERRTLSVVEDQRGRPTIAGDLAEALLRLLPGLAPAQAGLYHVTNAGPVVSWHGFACAIFEHAACFGLEPPTVTAIPSEAYPTPARRPANSALDTGRFAAAFGPLPDWQDGLWPVVRSLTR